MALTTLRAGLALIVIASLVNGLMPGRALVAGLRMTLSLTRPGMLKTPRPFLPRSFLIMSPRTSITEEICFLLSPVPSERVARTSDLLGGLTAVAVAMRVFLLNGVEDGKRPPSEWKA